MWTTEESPGEIVTLSKEDFIGISRIDRLAATIRFSIRAA